MDQQELQVPIQLKRSNIDFKIICRKFGGIANNANKIENLLGFPDGISGQSFVSSLKQHFETLSIHFTEDYIQNISKENENEKDLFHIKCKKWGILLEIFNYRLRYCSKEAQITWRNQIMGKKTPQL